MASLGRWTGSALNVLPTTSWAAPNGLFPTLDVNSHSDYTFTSSTSTITLPSSDLADGYMVRVRFEFEDSSNGRANFQGRFNRIVGTGNFLSMVTSGYNRDNSEDRQYVQVIAFTDSPSASQQIQFQWKRDTDAPGTSDNIVTSAFEITPWYYDNIGMYYSTTAALYGGTTPNTVNIGTTTVESSSAAISRATNTVTLKGDNRRYLIIGGVYGEGFSGGTRTQRVISLEKGGTEDSHSRSYFYARQAADDNNGAMVWDIVETATADVTIELLCWRGDGVLAYEGGANVDGSTPAVAQNGLIIIELPEDAEVIRSHDATPATAIAVTGAVDHLISETGGVDFNDSASFSRTTDIAINTNKALDAFIGGNIFGAYGAVSSGNRFTCAAHITKNGVEDEKTKHGNYGRGNQSSTDTFGWAAQPGGFFQLANGDDIGMSTTELVGSEGGGGDVRSTGVSFWAINLDSLSGGTPPAGWTHKISSVSNANLGKVSTVAKANISKIQNT